MRFDDTPLSTGTAFFWEESGKCYLVTNWHNLSGRDANTLKHLNTKSAAEPNRAAFQIFFGRDLNNRGHSVVELYAHDGFPIWLEHPKHRNLVDVVCIPLPDETSANVFPINQALNAQLTAKIADEVFVIGYPLGLSVETTPIWKRASVASEPDFDINGRPMIYVDTASSRGMSGSPVLRRGTSGQVEDGSFIISGGMMNTLIGIYSGRVVAGNSLEAQLGIVWKKQVISEIIQGGMRGTSSAWIIGA